MRLLDKVIFVLLMPLIFWSCNQDGALSVSEYTLSTPASIPLLDTTTIGIYGNYGKGYLNGKIRSNQATISWAAYPNSSDFICYKICLQQNGSPVATIPERNDTTYTIKNLSADTYYKITVTTTINTGTSRTDTISIKTPKFQPPSNIAAKPTTKGGVKITWKNNAESATSFWIIRSSTVDQSTTFYLAVPDSAPGIYSYTDLNVLNSIPYNYKLAAWNPYESTTFTNSVTAAYNMGSPVLNLAQEYSSRGVELQWTDNSNAESGYRIYRCPVYAASWRLLNSSPLPANTLSYIDNDTMNLAFDTTYKYKIENFNDKEVFSSNTRAITINNKVPGIMLDSLKITFTPQSNGLYATSKFKITNSGKGTLYISNISVSNSRISISDLTNFSIEAAGYQFVNVICTPSDTLLHTDTIYIFHNAAGSPAKVIATSKITNMTDTFSEGFESNSLPANWITSPEYPWGIVLGLSRSGTRSAMSGRIPNNSSTFVYTNVNITGTKRISFSYYTSCLPGDYLTFYINGNVINRWGGSSSDWKDYYYDYTGTGIVQLYWEYHKDSTGTSGLDAAFIDDVHIN